MSVMTVLPGVVYLLILFLMVALVAAIFFNKTLKIDINIRHTHDISQVFEQKNPEGKMEEIKPTADEEMLKTAFHNVTSAVQLFQGLEVEDENGTESTR